MPALENAVCINPTFRKVEHASVSLSPGFGAMKRTTLLYTACLGALVSMSCSQGGAAPVISGPSAGTSAAQAGDPRGSNELFASAKEPDDRARHPVLNDQ